MSSSDPDPKLIITDPDPASNFESKRIRIHKTDTHSIGYLSDRRKFRWEVELVKACGTFAQGPYATNAASYLICLSLFVISSLTVGINDKHMYVSLKRKCFCHDFTPQLDKTAAPWYFCLNKRVTVTNVYTSDFFIPVHSEFPENH